MSAPRGIVHDHDYAKTAAMTDATVLGREMRRAPPRVDDSKLSQALRDLFASWRLSLQEDFKGLTASGEVAQNLFPLRATGASTAPMLAAVDKFLSSLDARQRAAAR